MPQGVIGFFILVASIAYAEIVEYGFRASVAEEYTKLNLKTGQYIKLKSAAPNFLCKQGIVLGQMQVPRAKMSSLRVALKTFKGRPFNGHYPSHEEYLVYGGRVGTSEDKKVRTILRNIDRVVKADSTFVKDGIQIRRKGLFYSIRKVPSDGKVKSIPRTDCRKIQDGRHQCTYKGYTWVGLNRCPR